MRQGLDYKTENVNNVNAVLDKAHKKAEGMFMSSEIKIEDFKDLYGEREIEKDLTYIASMEKLFKEKETAEEKEIKKIATVFEALFYEQAEQNNWLGENIVIIKTSSFDDIKNGADGIVESQESPQSPFKKASYLALAVDVKFGSGDISYKLKRIKDDIENGRLTQIKYFVSEYMDMRGELKNVPRVIVSASFPTVKELSELWINRNNKALQKHFIQFQIIDEMLYQLKMFEKYALSIGQKEIAEKYSNAFNLIEEIHKNKLSGLTDDGKRDKAFEVLKESVDSVFSEK